MQTIKKSWLTFPPPIVFMASLLTVFDSSIAELAKLFVSYIWHWPKLQSLQDFPRISEIAQKEILSVSSSKGMMRKTHSKAE